MEHATFSHCRHDQRSELGTKLWPTIGACSREKASLRHPLSSSPSASSMAKSKNTSAHHQNRKDHRNGIKKPASFKERNTKGMYQKFRRNLRRSRAGTLKALTATAKA